MALPTTKSCVNELHHGLHEGSMQAVGKDWGGPCLPEPHWDHGDTHFSVAPADGSYQRVDSFH